MGQLPHKLTSVTVGVVAFVGAYMFLFPTGCSDVGGVSSWERCNTVMGNPAFSLSDWGLANQFDILIPLSALRIFRGYLAQERSLQVMLEDWQILKPKIH